MSLDWFTENDYENLWEGLWERLGREPTDQEWEAEIEFYAKEEKRDQELEEGKHRYKERDLDLNPPNPPL